MTRKERKEIQAAVSSALANLFEFAGESNYHPGLRNIDREELRKVLSSMERQICGEFRDWRLSGEMK